MNGSIESHFETKISEIRQASLCKQEGIIAGPQSN